MYTTLSQYLTRGLSSQLWRQLLCHSGVFVTCSITLSTRISMNSSDKSCPIPLMTTSFALGILAAKSCPAVIVTIGSKGAVAHVGNETITIPGHEVDVVDTTGAGDCFCGYLAAGIAEGLSLKEALQLANDAAAKSVSRKGAAQSIPERAEVTP